MRRVVAPDADQEVHRHRASRPRTRRTGTGRARRRRRSSRSRAAAGRCRTPCVCLCTDSHELSSASGVRKPVSTMQQQADAVDADDVADAERRNPGVALDELEVGRRRVEARSTAAASRRTRAATRSARSCARTARSSSSSPRRRRAAAAPSDRQRDERGQNRETHLGYRPYQHKDTKDTKVDLCHRHR